MHHAESKSQSTDTSTVLKHREHVLGLDNPFRHLLEMVIQCLHAENETQDPRSRWYLWRAVRVFDSLILKRLLRALFFDGRLLKLLR